MRHHSGLTMTAVLIGGLTSAGMAAQERAATCRPGPVLRERFFQPGRSLVTPHIAWLKPYAGGKLKALFVVTSAGMREVVELGQRMDLDATVFRLEKPGEISRKPGWCWVPGEGLEDKLERLDRLLARPYDVIVLGAIDWDALPLGAKYKILRKVHDGAGLVGTVLKRGEFFPASDKRAAPVADRQALVNDLAGFPFHSVPPFTSHKTLGDFMAKTTETLRLGKGRICLFRYAPGAREKGYLKRAFHPLTPGPTAPLTETDLTDYDYHLALVIRALLWAARKAPTVAVRPTPAQVTVAIDRVGTGRIAFAVTNPGKTVRLNGRLTVLNAYGEQVAQAKTSHPCPTGASVLSFPMPALGGGAYRANVIVTGSGGKGVNFATAGVRVTAPVAIKTVELGATSFRRGQPIYGTVELSRAGKGLHVRVEQRDTYGRLTGRTVEPARGRKVAFRLANAQPLTIVGRVHVSVVDARGRVLATARKPFSICDLYVPGDEMRVMLWHGQPRSGTFYAVPILSYYRQRGIDSTYVFFNEAFALANLRHGQIVSRLTDVKTDSYNVKGKRDKGDLVRLPCLNDPAYRGQLMAICRKKADELRHFSVREYSLGDECSFAAGSHDLCFSPHCVKAFNRFVRDKYTTIGALNAAYGTRYASFDAVAPQPIDEARNAKQIAMWVDHRLHMDASWAGIYKEARDQIRTVLPAARVGFEAPSSLDITYAANDAYLFGQSMDVHTVYHSHFRAAVIRSFFTRDSLLGLGWFGGYSAPYNQKHFPRTIHFPWLHLLKGCNSFWVWHAAPGNGSITAPDYAFYTFFEDALESIGEMKRGLGKVLLRADRQTDVGLLYSRASMHAATFVGGPHAKIRNSADLVDLLVDLGYQTRVYASPEVSAGRLTRDKPSALVLHHAIALSDGEVAEIRRYVADGGLVIADLRPGVRDGLGRVRKRGALDDVFGVTLSTAKPYIEAPRGALRLKGQKTGDPAFPPVWHDPATTLNGGTALADMAGAPAVIQHTFGRGKALLLNFNTRAYSQLRRKWAKGECFRAPFRSAFQWAGVQPRVQVAKAMPGLEIACFRSGAIQYVAALRDMPEFTARKSDRPLRIEDLPVEKATLLLPIKAHVYDMRRGKYLGFAQKVSVGLRALEPVILALLPYQVARIGLAPVTTPVRQGEPVMCNVTVKPRGDRSPGEHVVRIDVQDPAGRTIDHYGRNLAVTGTRAVAVPLAINDPPGQWTVVATDVATGTQARVVVQVVATPAPARKGTP